MNDLTAAQGWTAPAIAWITRMGMTWVGFWTGVASLAAAASAGFAAWQLRSARLQTSRSAAFEHFREIDARLRDLWSADVQAVQRNIIRAYRGEAALTDADKLYMVFLNSLDLLAFAREEGVADRELVDRYIPTLLRSSTITVGFLTEFQQCCGDHQVYEHLSALLQQPTILESIHVKESALGPATAATPAPSPGSAATVVVATKAGAEEAVGEIGARILRRDFLRLRHHRSPGTSDGSQETEGRTQPGAVLV